MTKKTSITLPDEKYQVIKEYCDKTGRKFSSFLLVCAIKEIENEPGK